MIKTLQKKFVVTAMIAITLLLVVLLGAINVASFVMVDRRSEETLKILSDGEGLNLPPIGGKPNGNRLLPQVSPDTVRDENYFIVRVDENGNIVGADIEFAPSITQEIAADYARKVLAGNTDSGKTDQYKFKITMSRNSNGRVIVFLKNSAQTGFALTVLVISVSIGIVCWLLMLLLVIILSRKAIIPISLNIEKQKQFVTNAGHEIKTPLAIILSNTDAMELYNGENKWSRNIREQVLRLNGLMQNLLTLSKMDEIGNKLPVDDFSLSTMIEDAVKPFSQAASVKNIKLITDIQSGINLRANKDSINQLMSILLDNAVKYTNANGRITVFLKKDNQSMIFGTENTTETAVEGNADRLFDRFYREDDSRTQNSGGYGIGLSAARAITEANGGTINASVSDGDTIVFTVRF